MKKRLLFIAYYFPPFPGIASIRTKNIALYLSKLGWDVTVLTLNPGSWAFPSRDEYFENYQLASKVKYIYTDHWLKFLMNPVLNPPETKITRPFRGFCRIIARKVGIDPAIGWVKPALDSIRSIKENEFDIILVSGGPFSTFLVAEKLADYFKIPFVLDYRDGWTIGNPYKTRKITEYEKSIEKRILDKATRIICVSRGISESLKTYMPLESKISIVTNGYDPIELESIEPYDFETPSIVYTGNLHPPKRDIGPLFAALNQLKEKNKQYCNNWRFHYFGKNSEYVNGVADAYQLNDNVITHGFVDRKVALSALKSATVVVVITSIYGEDNLADKGIVTGKIFEAIGLKKRILLIAPQGSDAEEILKSTGLGQRFSGSEITGMADYLEKYIIEPIRLNNHQKNDYSWRQLSLKLNEILSKSIQN